MNESLMSRSPATQMSVYQESKELSEIKGKMYLARQFPRDPEMSMQNVLRECQRKDLAEAEKKFGELVTRMDRRFAFGEAEVDLSISVGVVIVEEKVSYDDLFKAADQTLYSVKEKGKNNYRMVSYKSIYKQK